MAQALAGVPAHVPAHPLARAEIVIVAMTVTAVHPDCVDAVHGMSPVVSESATVML
jgi:hypothetical protein